eukprot:356778-Chlamydomonas_euryale.AAC.6
MPPPPSPPGLMPLVRAGPVSIGPGPVEKTRLAIPELSLYFDPLASVLARKAVLSVCCGSTCAVAAPLLSRVQDTTCVCMLVCKAQCVHACKFAGHMLVCACKYCACLIPEPSPNNV